MPMNHLITLFKFLKYFRDLGTRNGVPKYVVMFCILQSAVLFIPESTWMWFGINFQIVQEVSPEFVRHYIINSTFQNAMSAFWITSPFTFFICTFLWAYHLNTQGYQKFLARRTTRLKKLSKTSDYTMTIGALALIFIYVWSTAAHLAEPTVLGGFVPTKNRFAMLLFQAGALVYVLPALVAGVFTDIRANLTT